MKNVGWLSDDMQANIDHPPIPLIKFELDGDRTTHIIKVKMRRNPSSVASETYKVNMNTLDDGQPEEFLSLLRNFNIATDGTGTTTPYSWINYLRAMLRGQALRGFDKLQSQYVDATDNHLKLIQEGLLEYIFPIDKLSKQKYAMRRAMRKTQSIKFKRFAARLTEMNNSLPLFPGSDA